MLEAITILVPSVYSLNDFLACIKVLFGDIYELVGVTIELAGYITLVNAKVSAL